MIQKYPESCLQMKSLVSYAPTGSKLACCRKAAAAVVEKAAAAVQDCGINFWTLDEKTWWYLGGLLAVQVISREVLKRWGGAFKSDAALVAHQVDMIRFTSIAHRIE